MHQSTTRQRTREIAQQLKEQGQIPSARAVLKVLGNGSLSTISDEIKKMSTEESGAAAPLPPPATPPAPLDPGVAAQLTVLADVVSHLADQVQQLRLALETSQAQSEAQLKQAYERFEAVQRLALRQVDEARRESVLLREKLRVVEQDAQVREDVMRGKAQILRDENQRLLGRIEAMELLRDT